MARIHTFHGPATYISGTEGYSEHCVKEKTFSELKEKFWRVLELKEPDFHPLADLASSLRDGYVPNSIRDYLSKNVYGPGYADMILKDIRGIINGESFGRSYVNDVLRGLYDMLVYWRELDYSHEMYSLFSGGGVSGYLALDIGFNPPSVRLPKGVTFIEVPVISVPNRNYQMPKLYTTLHTANSVYAALIGGIPREDLKFLSYKYDNYKEICSLADALGSAGVVDKALRRTPDPSNKLQIIEGLFGMYVDAASVQVLGPYSLGVQVAWHTLLYSLGENHYNNYLTEMRKLLSPLKWITG